ncbi:MAG: ABC transporter substrate-binding protein [Cenarchaeum sp. SB0665_bin_23]|nr:ABC transporter substrate-binding protein [Cenarchaeum sp. SB0664_bin_35]MXY60818.1 ABC transporter substrate-binding protein [Cenarchaeum sp. SB0665_bin_23]MYB47296.1 ABC transporter substrate-binding protein [Cenarchaeum sp. SB0662_bin_33]MYG32476.1 ABC transporter substrate-binding protein [Cenarchaeum sp. SB0677_bin_16]
MWVRHCMIIMCLVAVSAVPLSLAELQGDVLVGIPGVYTDDEYDRGAQISLAIRAGIMDFNEFLDDMNAGWHLVGDDALEDATIILGPINNETLEYVQSDEILVVGCCAADASMAIPGDTVFQLYADSIKQGDILARILRAQGVDVVVPIYGAGTYGDTLWRSMSDRFVTDGGIVDEGIRYTDASISLAVDVLAQRVQHNIDTYSQDADVAVLMISRDEGLHILESALSHDVLHMVPWFADEYMTGSSALVQNSTVSGFLESTNYTSIQMAKTHSIQHDHIESLVEEQHGTSPGAFVYTAYDAVWILGLSILEAGIVDITSISGALPDVADKYIGILGDIKLDVSGDMLPADYTLWSIRNSEWERISRYAHQTDEIMPILPSTVVIPVIADITGDLSVLGREGLAGMALAVDDFNMHQQEISANWRLELDIMDSETDPERHLELIRGVNNDIVLSCASSNSLAKSLDHINEQGTTVISSCSTSVELSIPDSLYRLYTDDGNIIGPLASYLKGKHTIMLVRNDSWGTSQSLQLSGQLQNHTIISYMPGTQDYNSTIYHTLDAINMHNIDETAILLLGFAESADILAAAADHDVLYMVPWFGSNGNARHQDIVSDTRSAGFAELVKFTALANADAVIPARLQQDISNDMGLIPLTRLAETTLRLDRYVSERVPVAYSSGPVAYDSVWLTAITLNSTQTLQSEVFQDTFVDVAASYVGITGHTALNEAGDLLLTIYDTWTVQNGEWIFQSRYADGEFLSIDDLKLRSLATLVVENAIADFGTNQTMQHGDEEHSLFIMDMSTGEIVVYTTHPNLVGMPYGGLINSQGANIGDLIVNGATPSGLWISYMWPDPDTGTDEFVTAWVRSFGDYVFGSSIR